MLLTDRSKFKHIDKDPTIMKLKTVQNYLNKLFNCGGINEEQKKLMTPKAAQFGRAYGPLKLSGQFNAFLNFDQSLTL